MAKKVNYNPGFFLNFPKSIIHCVDMNCNTVLLKTKRDDLLGERGNL